MFVIKLYMVCTGLSKYLFSVSYLGRGWGGGANKEFEQSGGKWENYGYFRTWGGGGNHLGAILNPEILLLQELGSQYKFYLALENSLCQDYISEKFWNALGKFFFAFTSRYRNRKKSTFSMNKRMVSVSFSSLEHGLHVNCNTDKMSIKVIVSAVLSFSGNIWTKSQNVTNRVLN